MTTLRFTPANAGSTPGTGRFTAASDWSPQQAPGAGDTAIITTGTLSIANQTLTNVNLFAFTVSQNTGTGPVLQTQSVVVAAGSNIIEEGNPPFNFTGLVVTSSFENDGRIELSDSATLGALTNYRYSIVNKGTISLRDTTIGTSNTIENDGTISISSRFSPDFGSVVFGGTGSLVIEPNTTIAFGRLPAGQTVVLAGGSAAHITLRIDSSPGYFNAPIAGFVAGDTIRVSNFYGTATNVTYAATGAHAGRLTVGAGSSTATINLIGDYSASDFTAVASSGSLSIATSRTDQGVDDKSAIYRFFNTLDGTHFYTSSTAERDTIVNTRSDLSFEGVGLNAADPNSAAAAPVYRFFETNNGTHFYTDSAAERDTILATRSDLSFEGIAFYEHATAQSGDTAIYRFFDTRLGTHFYTASAPEAASVTQTRPDLTAEGIGFYAPA